MVRALAVRKKSMLHLILGGAALQRCDNQSVFTSGFSRRGQVVRGEGLFPQPVHSCRYAVENGPRFSG
jgi:hypothetical protein